MATKGSGAFEKLPAAGSVTGGKEEGATNGRLCGCAYAVVVYYGLEVRGRACLSVTLERRYQESARRPTSSYSSWASSGRAVLSACRRWCAPGPDGTCEV